MNCLGQDPWGTQVSKACLVVGPAPVPGQHHMATLWGSFVVFEGHTVGLSPERPRGQRLTTREERPCKDWGQQLLLLDDQQY